MFPTQITREQILQVCAVLGLPAVMVKEIHIDADEDAVVTVYARDQQGKIMSYDGKTVTADLFIPFVETTVPAGTQADPDAVITVTGVAVDQALVKEIRRAANTRRTY